MTTKTSVQSEIATNVGEKIEMVKWHIQRYDALRASTANRAAMVLSANALLLASSTFLLDKIVANLNLYSSYQRCFVLVSVSLTLLLLAISIFYAIRGVIAVSKTSRDLFGYDIPKHPFFSQRDTIESFSGFQSFKEGFMDTNSEKMLSYALGDLWTVINQHFYRYQNLRTAIRFLSAGIVVFLISAFALILFIMF